MYINYDRTSNPLLGLDILQEFSFVCGISKVFGSYMFIGCLRDQKDKYDYYEAIEKHFGYVAN